ncbi:MAG: mannose-1-phosphate guanyltransferase [Clostridiales bacterium]
MKAIIMAGGEGSRLRPLTCDLPKPMVPIVNKPVMEHIIDLLKYHNIKDIGVTLMFMPQKIKDYFGDGSNYGVKITYFTERYPLGTAGSVKNAESFLDSTFLVISGDSLSNLNITKALKFHKQKKSKTTLILTKVNVPLDYGVVITNSNSEVTGFLEKPSWGEVISDTVNTGTYIIEPETLKFIEPNTKFDFSSQLFPLMLDKKKSMFGYISSDYWCDIGDLNAYMQSHYDILDKKIILDFNYNKVEDNILIGQGTTIEQGAKINSPCIIGNNCRIESNSLIDSYSIIGDNTVIEESVSLKRSILWNNNFIEFGSELRATVLCNKVHFKPYVSSFEGSVIGDDCLINERAIIKPSVKIWPQKSIDPLSIVDRNVIWGSKHAKSIFGENGLSGIINVDITPEFASRLGAAYGSTLGKGSKVAVSSTNSNSARMFKHAFVSGILSVGVEVFNLSSLLTPISRHAINFLAVEGGIHVKLSNDNPNKLRVDFMDSKGASISRVYERKIENSFFREDFKRCSGNEINRLNNLTDFQNYYVRSILNEINTESIRKIQPKVFIVSTSDFVISLVVPMVTDLGCKVVSFSSKDFNSTEIIMKEIKKSNADFGAYIDSNGETLTLIGQDGTIIKDDLFLSLISLIIFKSTSKAKVVVPITAPSVIDTLAKKNSGTVVRTKTSSQAVMEQMLNHNLFKYRENMEQFLLNFDALAGLVKIIEHLCINDISLEDLLNEIPEFYVSKKKIFCPWELKGKVMRTLITEIAEEKVELLDGVKFILDDGWALVLPDADMPMCRIFSEGKSPLIADVIADRYLDRIKSIINTK